MSQLKLNCRIWMYSAGAPGVFGDGKARLLETVDRLGSLAAASKSLGISYRKAWGDIRKAEACLKINLTEKIRGGASGGETVLTPDAKKLLRAYRQFCAESRKNMESSFKKNMKEWIGA